MYKYNHKSDCLCIFVLKIIVKSLAASKNSCIAQCLKTLKTSKRRELTLKPSPKKWEILKKQKALLKI